MAPLSSRRRTSRELNGAITPVAERWNGKRLNRPNDVVGRSDGSLYFTKLMEAGRGLLLHHRSSGHRQPLQARPPHPTGYLLEQLPPVRRQPQHRRSALVFRRGQGRPPGHLPGQPVPVPSRAADHPEGQGPYARRSRRRLTPVPHPIGSRLKPTFPGSAA